MTKPEPPAEVDPGKKNVHQAIAAVMADLGREGIAKDRKTEGNGPKYSFRGIDDVYNALSATLARHQLTIVPRCVDRQCVERKSNSGGALFYVTVEAEFVLTSASDGSSITARTFGEALDSGDKATNKAMSAAYKYMAMQTFCIPTEGDNDADATNHQLASAEQQAISHLRSVSIDKGMFTEAWNANKEAWKRLLDEAAYRRVVGVMKEIAATFPKEEAAPRENRDPNHQAAVAEISADEIPY
jgi:hypothetical protein